MKKDVTHSLSTVIIFVTHASDDEPRVRNAFCEFAKLCTTTLKIRLLKNTYVTSEAFVANNRNETLYGLLYILRNKSENITHAHAHIHTRSYQIIYLHKQTFLYFIINRLITCIYSYINQCLLRS